MRLVLVFLILFQFGNKTDIQKQGGEASVQPNSPALFHYKIIPALHQTYGYEIYRENTVIIRQPTIPGRPGLHGFRSKSDAKKVAALALSKIKKGTMPPTILQKEMEILHIHF